MTGRREPEPQVGMRRDVTWCLREMMAERGIRTATELKRRLSEEGISLSRQQISKVVANAPSRVSLDLVAGLAKVLACGAGDLIRVGRDRENGCRFDPGFTGTSVDVGKAKGIPPGDSPETVMTRGNPTSPSGGQMDWLEKILAFPFRPYPLRAPSRPGRDEGEAP